MRIIALIIALLGILVLGLLVVIVGPVGINDGRDLDDLEMNTKIKLDGKVIEERVLYEGTKLMRINEFEVICECSKSFKGKEVRIEGMVEEFDRKRQVRALKVEVIN